MSLKGCFVINILANKLVSPVVIVRQLAPSTGGDCRRGSVDANMTDPIKIKGNDITKKGEKLGWYQGNDVYNAKGEKVGYFSGNDIYDKSGKKLGYVKENKFRGTTGESVGADKINKTVKGGNASLLERAAIRELFGRKK